MKTKWLLIFGLVLLVVGVGATAAFVSLSAVGSASDNDDPALAPLVKVTQATTATGAGRGFTGSVSARVQSNLGFRVPGKITERLVDAGQYVRAGQPLMRIDQTDLSLAVTAKRNAGTAARAAVIQARADERRYASLVESGAVSRQGYEQKRTALETTEAQLAAAEAEARVADNAATYSVLTADADGTVVETLGEPGQVVPAGQTVLRLAHSGPREAVVALPETVRPAIGSVAEASMYGNERRRSPARLRQLSDSADPQTRTYEARYVLEGDAASAPIGSTVTIRIANNLDHPEVKIPLGAVLDDGTKTGVWVLDRASSTVRFRPISIRRLGEETAVVSGLEVGVSVVALGAHLLQDGVVVRVSTEKAGEP